MKYLQYPPDQIDCYKEKMFKRDFNHTIELGRGQQKSKVTSMRFKRFRSAFTTEQVTFLEEQFKKCAYINNIQRKEVAKTLNINERAVKVWFQNRRMKEKHASVMNLTIDLSNKVPIERNNNEKSSICDADYGLKSKPLSEENCNESCNNVNNLQPANSPANVLEVTPIVTTKIKCEQESPLRDKYTVSKVVSHNNSLKSNICKNSSRPYESSAEFAIELCKKYKNISENQGTADKFRRQINENNKPTSPTVCSGQQNPISRQNVFNMNSSILPQTIPTEQFTKSNYYPDNHRSNVISTTNTPSYLPHNFNTFYTQPPTSANMIWKPINVLPLVSTGASSATISNSPGSLFVSPQQNLPKKNCNCDCHLTVPDASLRVPELAQSPYIITAIPFHHPTLNSHLNSNYNLMF